MKALLTLLAISLASLSFSQDWKEGIVFSTATITEDYCVQLDADNPVQEWYEMDITHLGFASQDEANKAFWSRANNLVSYNVDLSENKAYARVHLDRTPEPKDINWWNDYLNSLCPTE